MNTKIDKSIGETEDWFRGQCNQLYGTGFHPKYPGHENFFNPPYNTVLPGDSSGQDRVTAFKPKYPGQALILKPPNDSSITVFETVDVVLPPLGVPISGRYGDIR
jgi:hypothetical protein